MALSHRTEGAGQGILQPVQRQDRSSDSGTIQGHGIIPDDRPSRNGPLHRAFLTTGRGLHHPFGTCGYAREEIIAEFTAAVTGRDLGIAVTPRKENAQYLKSWLSNLKEDPGYVMSVLREAGKASAMIEESVEKQHTLADTSAREEDISPLPIKEEGNNETVSSGILDMYDRSKEQYPDTMALIRVGDEYKAYNQDAERLHEVLGVCARKAVSEKDGTPVMTASFRHVDLDTHLRSIIKAGSKVAINHYEKAAAPDKSMTPPLLFKGGRREIEITSEGAVIRTNGNQYDATGILKGLEKAGIDVRNISGSQWESMLRGRGTVLNPAKQKMLFSIRKQPSGYGVRIADISGKISSSVKENYDNQTLSHRHDGHTYMRITDFFYKTCPAQRTGKKSAIDHRGRESVREDAAGRRPAESGSGFGSGQSYGRGTAGRCQTKGGLSAPAP